MKKERHHIICAAYLLLEQGGNVLLLRRFNTGYEDGNYSVPAGHVEKGESVADCLVREAQEEIGITLKKDNLQLRHVMHRGATATNEERLDFFFTCAHWEGTVTNREPEKCDDLSWFGSTNLPKNIIPYIKMALESVFQKGDVYSELNW